MSTYATDPRVDDYITALPDWQQDICRSVRDLVHARVGAHSHHPADAERGLGTVTSTARTWPVGVRKSLGHWAVTM